MNTNFNKCLNLVLQSEGLYVDNSKDPGGETMRGVTRNAWAGWLKRPIEDGEMAKLTVEDVTPFYKALYWDKTYCDELPVGVDYIIFDAAVNMGSGQSVKLLQEALGCFPDGVLGPNTLNAIEDANPISIVNNFSTEKEDFYKQLKTFPIFGKGWLNRVEQVKTRAIEMINGN
jgi:hypothetical protein